MKLIKGLSIAIAISVLFMWILAFYYYFALPNKIATHFDINGIANSYGNKSTLFVIPFLFSIAPLLILIIVKYRFKIIKKYPYLINLPAFFCSFKDDQLKDYLIDKYFEAMLGYTLILTLSLLFAEIGIFEGSFSGRLPKWFDLVISIPIVAVIPYLFYLKKLYSLIDNR